MNTRFMTNILLAIIGGFLLVASFAFTVIPFHWLMFGGGVAAVAIGASGALISSRGPIQRGLDVLTVVIGSWTIVASLVFGGLAVAWLGFASGGALALVALAGLMTHEFSTERVVHSLEVKAETPPSPQETPARTRRPTVAV